MSWRWDEEEGTRGGEQGASERRTTSQPASQLLTGGGIARAKDFHAIRLHEALSLFLGVRCSAQCATRGQALRRTDLILPVQSSPV
ncbi:hypothetical protein VFPFJ_03510 [Purpureocillium lilacinum]|uniref:Uncharacterized protein n=1 Tax=Purpureocillium lilacinum TaxID=33203 RepID=A0A179HQS3_PURLI|nr:hypothetical protein VFPFJ_03510 [Purpureocillium lilacinum]OAQ91770.1 hypothetical protein VFPFJ_03510 [Purpureocillium lilacinum]